MCLAAQGHYAVNYIHTSIGFAFEFCSLVVAGFSVLRGLVCFLSIFIVFFKETKRLP